MARKQAWIVSALLLSGFPAVAGLVININAGPQLAADSAALLAFGRAAAAWSGIFTDPITVTINADFGTFGNNNIIGATSSVLLQADYTTLRNAVVYDSLDEPADLFASGIPQASEFSALMPNGFSLSGNLFSTKANLKALGFTGLDNTFGTADATMTFNRNFNFYYGVGTFEFFQVDFQTVALHEIGHALGFVSAVDTIDLQKVNGQTAPIIPSLLDLFRFPSGNTPANLVEFRNNPRQLDTGPAVFSDVVHSFAMSTGVYTGDGNQASHWQDDPLAGQLIGAMDPTLPNHMVELLTSADIQAMSLIGYDLPGVLQRASCCDGYFFQPLAPTPEPGTMLTIGGALAIALAARAMRRRIINGGAG